MRTFKSLLLRAQLKNYKNNDRRFEIKRTTACGC